MQGANKPSEFQTLVHRIEALWSEIWPIISSFPAVRIYMLIVIALAVLIAVCAAYQSKKKLTKLQAAAINLKFPGPPPAKAESIEDRKIALNARAKEELLPFRQAMWRLLIAGFLVPTAIFLSCTLSYGWFDPLGLPFFDVTQGLPMQSVEPTSIAWFVLNQFSHGALFDLLEVFDIGLSEISNNPHNWWFSSAVLLYRSIMSAFVVALIIAIAQFANVSRVFDRQIADKIREFKEAATSQSAA